jgi:hypothetical protein
MISQAIVHVLRGLPGQDLLEVLTEYVEKNELGNLTLSSSRMILVHLLMLQLNYDNIRKGEQERYEQ